MSKFPSDLKYTKEHEWAKVEADGRIRIGVTEHAVEQLGDITLVDLPKVGSSLEAHKRFGDIESVKAVSELFAPLSGEVVEVNGELEGSPELVNEGPYDKGWMLILKPSGDLSELMDAEAYEAFVGSLS